MDHRRFRLAAVHELIGDGAGWKAVLWGDLAGVPVPELLNILGHGHRSGVLLVLGADQSERALGFSHGRVTWVASSEPSERTPVDLVFGLLRLHHGLFTYLRGPVDPGDGPSVQELLLDGLCRLDEAGRLEG